MTVAAGHSPQSEFSGDLLVTAMDDEDFDANASALERVQFP
jgi:hypothetical protein